MFYFGKRVKRTTAAGLRVSPQSSTRMVPSTTVESTAAIGDRQDWRTVKDDYIGFPLQPIEKVPNTL